MQGYGKNVVDMKAVRARAHQEGIRRFHAEKKLEEAKDKARKKAIASYYGKKRAAEKAAQGEQQLSML